MRNTARAFAILTLLALPSLSDGVFAPPEAGQAQDGGGWAQPPEPNGKQPLVPLPLPPAAEKDVPITAQAAGIVAPINDAFASALPVTSAALPYSNAQDTTAAAVEDGEPNPCVNIGLARTIWYSFTPRVNGIYQVDTQGSNYDTAIAVYEDTEIGIGGLIEIDCNDDITTLRSAMKFNAEADTTYAIQVGGFQGAGGSVQFNVAPAIGRTDAVGDAVHGFGGSSALLDVSNVTVAHDENSIEIRMDFATGIAAPSASQFNSIVGIVDIDLDRNAGTGTAPTRNAFGFLPLITMADEYQINLIAEQTTPGFVPLIETAGGTTVASLPIRFTPTSFHVSIPRSAVGFPPTGSNDASAHVAALIGGIGEPTDAWPQSDPPGTSCTTPWNWNTYNDCFALSGLWHLEFFAAIAGMSDYLLAFNTGCTGPGATGCTYDVGFTAGDATSPPFGPLPATGGTLRFKTARDTENFCGFADITIVSYSTDYLNFSPLPLAGGTISPGGQFFGESVGGFTGEICGGSLTAQTVTVPLPVGTTNIRFTFDSGDSLFNAFAGQFIDEVQVCTATAVSLVDGCLDNCPSASNANQADNDNEVFTHTGFPWIPDGTGPEGINTGGDACDINDDNDLRCTDGEETGGSLALGGMRNPHNPWDFADVPVPALPAPTAARNGAVALTDVNAALSWVGRSRINGTSGTGQNYLHDNNINGVPDGVEYDRTPAGDVSGPPNDAITLQDLGVILAQVGDNCMFAPN